MRDHLKVVLAIAKPRLAQQLVPFRLIVERNVEQAAALRYGKNLNRALMLAAAVTTVLERIEQASLQGREGAASNVLCARATRGLGRPLVGHAQWGPSSLPLREA